MTAIRNQRGGVRRGVSIAAAALSLALVAPAIQPVQVGFAPTASAQDATPENTANNASGGYVPANVGRVFDEGKDLRYAGLPPYPSKVRQTARTSSFRFPTGW